MRLILTLLFLISCDKDSLSIGSSVYNNQTNEVGKVNQIKDNKILFTATAKTPTRSKWIDKKDVELIGEEKYQTILNHQKTAIIKDQQIFKLYTYAMAINPNGEEEPVKILKNNKLGYRLVEFQCESYPEKKEFQLNKLIRKEYHSLKNWLETCKKP